MAKENVTDRLPVTVIGGYLGAGKTSLLNHLLRHHQGVHFAILVNDFGQINIDAELIESRESDRINLTNGCICCSLATGFIQTMRSLLELDPRPERVLVEASGVSDPFQIAQYAHLPGFQLDSILVVVDGEAIRRHAADRYVGRQVVQQLAGADLLLLNKVDLIDEEQRVAVRHWLHEVHPEALIVEMTDGEIPISLLFGDIPSQQPISTKTTQSPLRADDAGSDGAHQYQYASWSYIGDQPLVGEKLRIFLDNLPQGVLRGKGFAYLEEDLSTAFIVQLVGKRWALDRGSPWGASAPATRLVLIGLPDSLDPERLTAQLEAMQIKLSRKSTD